MTAYFLLYSGKCLVGTVDYIGYYKWEADSENINWMNFGNSVPRDKAGFDFGKYEAGNKAAFDFGKSEAGNKAGFDFGKSVAEDLSENMVDFDF
jgi:uncharacterized protein YjdB